MNDEGCGIRVFLFCIGIAIYVAASIASGDWSLSAGPGW